jgi:protein-S-isoprenylcysteine O-methyltransferase Ste14
MYVGVLLILIGWTAAFRTESLVVYTMVVAILFHLRVVLFEEPWLARTFPQDWPELNHACRDGCLHGRVRDRLSTDAIRLS